jgi:hypothetical protein
VNRLEHIAGFGDLGKINLGLDLFGGRLVTRSFCRLGGTFGLALKVAAHLLRDFRVNRAGVALLVVNADGRQEVKQRFALYFQLTGQIIDANFFH